tara:strand:- start:1885 stop:2139 length:255 start_codon:yes stop_codon:yes gene_type:complete
MVTVKLNQHVAIAVKEDASERTLARIENEGAKGFVVRDHIKEHKSFGGGEALLLESLVDGPKRGDRWLGWIPLDEISAIGPWNV